MVGNCRTIRLAIRYEPNILLVRDWLQEYSNPFEQPVNRHLLRGRYNGLSELKHVRDRVIEYAHTPYDLLSVFTLKHRRVKLNAAKWIPDFMCQFHGHLAHRGQS